MVNPIRRGVVVTSFSRNILVYPEKPGGDFVVARMTVYVLR